MTNCTLPRFGRIVVAGVVCALLSFTAISCQSRAQKAASQRALGSDASLAETLNWLQEFLPKATGEKSFGLGDSTLRVSTALKIRNGCNLTINNHLSDNTGETDTSYELSLVDIDPDSIKVMNYKLPLTDGTARTERSIQVGLGTRNGAPLIRVLTPLVNPVFSMSLGTFVDAGSAVRAADAFRHAATLCANYKP